MIQNILLVGLGGAMGSIVRYCITLLTATFHGSANMATFIVNVIGSLVIGMLFTTCRQGSLLLFATVGFCGGFTTFSTFSFQALSLLQQGRYTAGTLYMGGTLICGLLCTLLGVWFGKHLITR